MNSCCVSCGNHELLRIRRYRTKTSHGRALFHESYLHECTQCGLVQTVPPPTLEELAEYYLIDYREGCYAGADVADVTKFPKDNLFYFNRGQSIAELLKPHIETNTPRILDIGAGFGHILYALGERFPDSKRVAIEFSEVCVKHLRTLGFQVYSQSAEEVLPQLQERFDVIVLSHVLEHLLNPVEMLSLIYESLAPGGILYIEVPNIPTEALTKYADNVWAPRFDEPHITFLSVPVLERLLQSVGFHVAFCETAGSEYEYISWLKFHLPHGRWFVQKLIPSSLFHFLRERSFTNRLRVQEREESFYQYGGFRIWIRSISRKREE